uniref:Uncharacterized protein n=1 Tax=Vibrio phage P018-4 TaxID=3229728 RepID=A0AB39AJZ7_9CAUD
MNLLDCVGEPVANFKVNNREYRKDSRAKNTLNKVLGANFKAVYREVREYKQDQWKSPVISWDGEDIYILRSDDKVVRMFNSEWSSICLES